jgi:CzcA family heavy metal efflux pump
MLRELVGSSIRLRFLVITFALVLVVFGIIEVSKIPIDLFPEFNPPMVEVQTEALGLSAAEMEALITVPIEADLLNGIAWLEHIYSESVPSLSSILLVFEEGTDPIRARQMVQERLTESFALPNVSKPPTMLQPLSTTSRVMMVGLSSDELSLIDLGVLARWNIKPRLMGVPGVANVAIWGKREWQLQVLVDPEELQDDGVSLRQVIETTGEALWVSPLSFLESSSPGTAGWIDTPNQRLSVRHLLPISSAEDMEQVPVKGTAYRLDDVAKIVEDHQPLIGDALLNDGPGLILVIEKFPMANTQEVTKGVEEALRLLSPGLKGVKMDTSIFRSANYLDQAFSNITILSLISLAAVIILFAIFFYEWRATLVSVLSIIISMVLAAFILYLQGVTLNIMTLAGLAIALGVVVDESINDMDNLLKRLCFIQENTEQESSENLIIEAFNQSRSTITFTSVIVLIFALPLFFLTGITGAFMRPFASAYVVAILVALSVALIVTPALSMLLFSGKIPRPFETQLMKRLKCGYQKSLGKVMRIPNPFVIAAVVLLGISLVLVPFLDTDLLPEFHKLDIIIEWEGPPGTSRKEMVRISSLALNELQEIPGVNHAGSLVGRAITGDKIVGINSGELWVSIDPTADYDSTIQAVRDVISGYPGFKKQVGNYQPELIDQVFIGTEQDLTIRLFGHEYAVLASNADRIEQAISEVDGIEQITIEDIIFKPQVEIEVDLNQAERFQIKPGDVRRSSATLISGLNVGNLYEEQKVFDVVVWGVPEIRENLEDLEELLIDTPRGGHVTLSEVADVRIVPAPTIIRRDAVSRYIDILVNVRGRSNKSVANEIESVLDHLDFPFEYHAEILGDYTNQQTNTQQIVIVSLISAFGIFLLLQAAYNSWDLATITLITWPFSLTGGVIAILLTGGNLSIGSIFGFFTVLAIVTRTAVLILNNLNQSIDAGQSDPLEQILNHASATLRPVLMTSLITGAVFLPFIIAGPKPGIELIYPMATVIVGGIVSATVFNLFILPYIYLTYGMNKTA